MARSVERWPALAPRRAFIVDDHPIFREGLTEVINSEADFKVCGAASTASQALSDILRLQPDLVLLDISLPDRSGLDLLRDLLDQNISAKILVLSMHDEAVYAHRVLELGADGYIMKQEDPAEIVHAMRDVLEGHIYLSEQVLAGQACAEPSASQPRPLRELSDQELEILELTGQQFTQSEIAQKLHLSVHSIKSALARIRRKLGLKSRTIMVQYAVSWVETGQFPELPERDLGSSMTAKIIVC